MSVYLVRSLLLSLFIAIFITVCYFMLREEVKSEPVVEFKKSLQRWSASFTLQASSIPFTGSTGSFKKAVEKNIQATTTRLKAAGLGFEVKLKNDSTYTVHIEGISDTAYISNLVAGNTHMFFCEVYTLKEIGDSLATISQHLFNFLNASAPYYDDYGKQVYPGYIGLCKLSDSAKVSSIISDPKVLSRFPPDLRFMFGQPEQGPGETEPYVFLYAVRADPDALSNRHISSATAEIDVDNKPVISFKFDPAGTKRWENLTRKNIGKAIAMGINDKVISTPNVLDAIHDGSVLLNLRAKMETSRIMSVLLTSEALLLPVKITSSHISTDHLSPIEKLSPLLIYALTFIAAFAISFCIIWFIFKPGRNAGAANP